MRKLPAPPQTFSQALRLATAGMSDATERARFAHEIPNPENIEAAYRALAMRGQLFSSPRTASRRGYDPIVLGTLRKSELVELYDTYFVPKGKPARTMYNDLKVTTNGKCPFCGDIGHVKTLDHFLPKANFPTYSVLPSNLVPCCRDCNSEKLNAFAVSAARQTLHPYFDDDRFFSERWVAARVVAGSPPVVEYYCSPPAHWTLDDKVRVATHFEDYGLAKRFGTEAGADLPETVLVRKTILATYSPALYADYLREKDQNLSLPSNNWRRVMFAALAGDVWFCTHRH